MQSTSKATAVPLQVPRWPHFEEEDIEAVIRVLRSGKVNYWTGQEGRHFEREYAEYVGTQHAIAVANGTVALELALRTLRIGNGDEVIVPSRTFIASASCVVMVGAKPVFADVDPQSQNLTVDSIRARITPRTRAIIAVHFAGWPCDMDPILQLAEQHNLKVIEDCAQAHGARYKGRAVGSMGDIGAFSFCQDKIMTTGGEGGMITLNDEAQRNFAWGFKDHGKRFDVPKYSGHSSSGALHETPGTNWRLTEMQSALGRNALRRLDRWVEARRRNAETLNAALDGISVVRVPQVSPELHHSYYKFYAFLEPQALRSDWSRDRALQEIGDAGVPCSAGGRGELHREKAFARNGETADLRPIAQALAATSLMFVVHPTLGVEHMEWMGNVIACILNRSTR
jgi:dTDP-4-amino-4,6-dideoxygalactose transaminase